MVIDYEIKCQLVALKVINEQEIERPTGHTGKAKSSTRPNLLFISSSAVYCETHPLDDRVGLGAEVGNSSSSREYLVL